MKKDERMPSASSSSPSSSADSSPQQKTRDRLEAPPPSKTDSGAEDPKLISSRRESEDSLQGSSGRRSRGGGTDEEEERLRKKERNKQRWKRWWEKNRDSYNERRRVSFKGGSSGRVGQSRALQRTASFSNDDSDSAGKRVHTGSADGTGDLSGGEAQFDRSYHLHSQGTRHRKEPRRSDLSLATEPMSSSSEYAGNAPTMLGPIAPPNLVLPTYSQAPLHSQSLPHSPIISRKHMPPMAFRRQESLPTPSSPYPLVPDQDFATRYNASVSASPLPPQDFAYLQHQPPLAISASSPSLSTLPYIGSAPRSLSAPQFTQGQRMFEDQLANLTLNRGRLPAVAAAPLPFVQQQPQELEQPHRAGQQLLFPRTSMPPTPPPPPSVSNSIFRPLPNPATFRLPSNASSSSSLGTFRLPSSSSSSSFGLATSASSSSLGTMTFAPAGTPPLPQTPNAFNAPMTGAFTQEGLYEAQQRGILMPPSSNRYPQG